MIYLSELIQCTVELTSNRKNLSLFYPEDFLKATKCLLLVEGRLVCSTLKYLYMFFESFLQMLNTCI